MSVESLIAFVALGINEFNSFVALLVGLVGGGTAGVALRAQHESKELRRDRMIKVAVEFVAAVQHAITALQDAESAIDQFAVESAIEQFAVERDEKLRADADAALSKVESKIYSAHVVIPRFNLIFPRVAVPVDGVQGRDDTAAHDLREPPTRLPTEDTPVHDLVYGLKQLHWAAFKELKALKELKERVVNPPPTGDGMHHKLKPVWDRFFVGHTEFVKYANKTIWHRWYDPRHFVPAPNWPLAAPNCPDGAESGDTSEAKQAG
jgi:hypothetical protein